MRFRPFALWIATVCFGVTLLSAGEVIPTAPAHYVEDQAGVLSSGVRDALLHEIEDFERQTSNQIVVAIYPHMQSDSSIEDYTVRVAQAWHVGQKGKDNGVVMFVFVNDHTIYIQVGYGLEGVLTDALCRRIIENEITPRFRNGDYNGGIQNGVHAIMAATRGEYKGTGVTVNQLKTRFEDFKPYVPILLFVAFWVFILWLQRRYPRSVFFSGSSFGSYGGGGSWGGGGGGFGGFSGGGGSFGGGGAGGSW